MRNTNRDWTYSSSFHPIPLYMSIPPGGEWGIYRRMEALLENLLYSKALSWYVLEYLHCTLVYQRHGFYTPLSLFKLYKVRGFTGALNSLSATSGTSCFHISYYLSPSSQDSKTHLLKRSRDINRPITTQIDLFICLCQFQRIFPCIVPLR